MAKELVEGVDFEMVKAKNSNAMVRNIFTAKEKAARAAKAETTSRPKPRVTQGAKPAKPREESPPPKRPAVPNTAKAGMTKAETAPPKRPAPPPMTKIDKAKAEAKATPAYNSKIGPKQQGKLIGAANTPAYNSKIGPTRTIKDKVITNTKRMIEEARRRTRSAVGIKD